MKQYVERVLLLSACLLCLAPAYGQDTLSLEEAIRIALEKHYGIQVARYNAQISENNATRGQAGFLPTVTFNASGSYNNNSSSVELIDPSNPGQTVRSSFSGLQTGSANANVAASYVVYNGGLARLTYQLSQNQAQLSEAQVATLANQLTSQIASAYFQLAQQYRRYEILLETEGRSRARTAFVRNQQAFGASNRLAVLNAEVDLYTDSINLATSSLTLANAKRDLNYLMGRDLNTPFEIERALSLAAPLSLESLQASLSSTNPDLQAARISVQLAELNLLSARARRYPRFSLNASYGGTYANNGPVSFARTIQSAGLAAGATLSMNLFDGFRTRTGIENAEISAAVTRVQLRDREAQAFRDLERAYATYQSNYELLRLNGKGLETATANFERVREAFELGQASSLQFREAQINLLTIENRLNDLRFAIKINEIELLRLAGAWALPPAE